ncbi:multicopper oxidase family protein [Brachybacterium hainanense]|uniref:Multicopper oxidase family protein n=1 Tax=Brachybacterium hainanense TaxID=1541174 RepID=A0ABV6RDV2_9MICO
MSLRRLPRRALLGRSALIPVAVLGAATLPGCSSLSTTAVTDVPVRTPLPIPPLAPSTTERGVRRIALTAQEGSIQLPGMPGPTRTWGFSGPFLGPTLRLRRGEDVEIAVTNRLPEPTSVHWHGMHLPAAMDGGPHQSIAPGATWTPRWQVDQEAATLWYHPHPHGGTERHVHRGLAGLVLLEDDRSEEAVLPREYGADDVPLIIQDRSLDADGQLVLRDDGAEPGMLGDTIMVNGMIGAYLEVRSALLRLRILNGATARTLTLGLADGRALTMIASDGGLLDEPIELTSLRLAPGERAEVLLALDPGETVRLRGLRTDLGAVAVPATTGAHDECDILELRAAPRLEPAPEPVWQARQRRLPDPAEAVRSRGFVLEGRTINGRRMDMSRIDEVVHLGTTEIWEVTNGEAVPHSFHVHDVQMRLLDIDGAAPPPELAGPKDTFYLEPRRRYRLVLRFERYADPHMPYMHHCHMLLHEDGGMMGQFVVIEPGQEHLVAAPGPGAHRS